jgi:16S rRNA (uracil1498-N3)-methyltransferase
MDVDMKHRFFMSPESIAQDRVSFDAAHAHQLRNVLRMRPGEHVIVLDNSGREYDVELTDIGRDFAAGRVCAQWVACTEPSLSLTLYQSSIKGDRFEWVLQKGTELGVAAFVPMFSKRSVLTNAERMEKKRPRWERIIREAAEQSHRGRLPVLAPPLPFTQACQESVLCHDLSLILWTGATGTEASLPGVLHSLAHRPKSIALLVGPEGGFDPEEVTLAQRQGIQAVTLGPRILRAETAGMASATIVMSELGEMGGR